MNETKHSEGIWGVTPTGFITCNVVTVAPAATSSKEYFLGHALAQSHLDGDEQTSNRLANARMMGASKRMYELLHKITHELREVHGNQLEEEWTDIYPAVEEAERLLETIETGE